MINRLNLPKIAIVILINSWNFVDHQSSIIWLKDTCNLGGSSSRLFSSFINSNFNLIATFNKLSLLGGVFYEIQCTFIALLAFDKYDMSSKTCECGVMVNVGGKNLLLFKSPGGSKLGCFYNSPLSAMGPSTIIIKLGHGGSVDRTMIIPHSCLWPTF